MNIFGFNFNLPKFFRLGHNRRRWERTRIIEVLYLDYKSNQPPLQGTAEAQNLSLGGIQFKSDKKIPKGVTLELKLRFAAGSTTMDSITVPVSVIDCSRNFRQKHFHVRCQFKALTAIQAKQLETFMEWWKIRVDKYMHFRYGDTA